MFSLACALARLRGCWTGGGMIGMEYQGSRRKTIGVRVGSVQVGGGAPIVVQSMSNTETADVAGIPASVDGLPTITEPSGRFESFALTKRYRPVPIGVSVGNNNECAAGTIGCQVWIGGQLYLLSNNHVLARENNASIGEPIVQPGRYDRRCRNYLSTDYVADLAAFEPIRFGGQNNTIDAAVASYQVSDVTCATLSSYYGYPSATPVSAYVGQTIKKVGRTTSQTTGRSSYSTSIKLRALAAIASSIFCTWFGIVS